MEQSSHELASGLPLRFRINDADDPDLANDIAELESAFDNVVSSLSHVSSPAADPPRFGDLSGVLAEQPVVQLAAEAAGAAAQAASAGLSTAARVAAVALRGI